MFFQGGGGENFQISALQKVAGDPKNTLFFSAFKNSNYKYTFGAFSQKVHSPPLAKPQVTPTAEPDNFSKHHFGGPLKLVSQTYSQNFIHFCRVV